MRFEWDPGKAEANRRAHGVTFAEAVSVLEDDFALTREDPDTAIVGPEPGKAKISIRLDNAVLDHFKSLVDKAGGGNYQTLINDALLAHIHHRSTLDAVRQALREELAPYGKARKGRSVARRK